LSDAPQQPNPAPSHPASALPAADLLPVQRNATLAFRLVRFFVAPLFHLLFRWQMEGRENIPRTGTFVLIANHLNWIDPFALVLAFPDEPKIHFLGNPEGLVKHRVQWRVVRSVGGYIAVNPNLHGNRTLYHYVDLCLGRGGVVALFPEGHYGSAEGVLEPFRKGFAHFAVDNQVPVLPVALSGMKDLWLRKTVRVVVGKPFGPGTDIDALVVEAEEQMSGLLPPYAEPPPGPRLMRQRLTHLF
jgi:1-acyl-sn-glycerol-3-phosphate acyltransferase